MINKQIKPQILLSTLWIFILFNMIFRDLHEFLNQEFLDQLFIQQVTQGEMLLYAIMLEIPIMMVLLSRLLINRYNKWTNFFAGGFMLLGVLSTLMAADTDDFFFGTMNIIALLVILRVTWSLPGLKQVGKSSHEKITYHS
ncbi:MAG: DUF6326 family protein [Bacteroidota bacterium]